MKVLVFDVWADYGHFRKYYTTSSPLTFSIPPPPTVAGMLGAIVGSPRDRYLVDFSMGQLLLGIGIRRPIRKTRMGINLVNTKDGYWQPVQKGNHEARTQIRTEFLRSPCYRLYVHHRDAQMFEKLQRAISEHRSYFTLAMGLSELLADFELVGVFEGEHKSVETETVSSVVPESYLTGTELRIEPGLRLGKEMIPVIMTQDRIVENYQNVIFEIEGKTLTIGPNPAKTVVVLENGLKFCTFDQE